MTMRELTKKEELILLRRLPGEVQYLISIWLIQTDKCKTFSNPENSKLEFACISKNDRRPDVWIYGSPDSQELADWLSANQTRGDFIVDVSLKEILLQNVSNKKPDYIDYHILKPDSERSLIDLSTDVKLLDINSLELINNMDEEGKTFFYEWINIENALEESIVYGVTGKNEIQSFAMTFAVSDKYMELGVWTKKEYRRNGLSYSCSNRLIDKIISEGKIPVWGADRSNIASLRLAEKLGFEKIYEYFWVSTIEDGTA